MSYFRNVFLDLAAAFSPMAPGNMKSDFIGLQRSKLTGKSYSTRKLYLKNSDGSSNETVSIPDNMDNLQTKVGTLRSNAPDSDPSAILNATAMTAARDVSNVAQSDNTKPKLNDNPIAGPGDGIAIGRCVVSPSDSTDKVNAEVSHLKVLSMLHLDVIEQQQRQIQMVEREAQRLRVENETLKSRLERMNRRTHLAEKVEPQAQTNNTDTDNHRPVGRPRKILDSPIPKKKRKSELKSELDLSINSTGKQSSCRGTPVKEESGNLNRSTSSVQAGSVELTKRQRRADKLAKKEEKKSAARQDSKESRESKEEEKFQRTEVMYPCLSDLRVPQVDLLDDESVMVPSWRVINVSPSTSSDAPEECTDAVFEHRHSKLEADERKRKRWDIQRIRELREHERLVNKQKQREYAQFEHILTTFYPTENDAEYIEMCETIPVITFGVQVPTVKPSEFELPWFDAKQRERDEQRRQTRRMTSRR